MKEHLKSVTTYPPGCRADLERELLGDVEPGLDLVLADPELAAELGPALGVSLEPIVHVVVGRRGGSLVEMPVMGRRAVVIVRVERVGPEPDDARIKPWCLFDSGEEPPPGFKAEGWDFREVAGALEGFMLRHLVVPVGGVQ